MRSLLINTSDASGGAAIAAYRLHKALNKCGIDSMMLVQQKCTDDPKVIGPSTNFKRGLALLRSPVDHIPKLLYPRRESMPFHLQWLPDFLIGSLREINPDIVHLHWTCKGFVGLKTLARIKQPIVWTLHDMWAFTGGCHYAGECRRYEQRCGRCPQLKSRFAWDLSRWTWNRKAAWWKNIDLNIAAPSQWMIHRVKESSLLKSKKTWVIPNGIDTQRYFPEDPVVARKILGLPSEKKLILFGAADAVTDKRKGFQLLSAALSEYSRTEQGQISELVVLGASEPVSAPDFGLKTTYLGRLSDSIAISLAYAACDVFVAPSIEDNLPNTVLEAMACGIPCVAFDVGGIPEMITHQLDGYLAQPFDHRDLAKGIAWVLGSKRRRSSLSNHARTKAVNMFHEDLMTQRYIELYKNVLDPSECD